MKGIINFLDEATINKIAAGEVIDRPASVIKELVENSIDAKSTSIVVEIKKGGKQYIRITDNGKGIEKDDLDIAFLRHTTSKIAHSDDLTSIHTLGFRGEALSSITAVSQVEMITKTKEADFGIQLNVSAGKITDKSEVGCPNGTTIIVKNLFYNVPVRKKFLKSDTTESSYISENIFKLALSYPQISFKYIREGKMIFKTSGKGDLLSCIYSLYGKSYITSLLNVSYDDKIKIRGYVSKPELTRGNKKHQFFYVNGRSVKSPVLSAAVNDAYKTLVTVNSYPIVFLFIDIEPGNIDVNIHPSKLEIRFDDDKYIQDTLKKAIKETLYKENLIRSDSEMSKPSNKQKDGFIDMLGNLKKSNFNKDVVKSTYKNSMPSEIVKREQKEAQIKIYDNKSSVDKRITINSSIQTSNVTGATNIDRNRTLDNSKGNTLDNNVLDNASLNTIDRKITRNTYKAKDNSTVDFSNLKKDNTRYSVQNKVLDEKINKALEKNINIPNNELQGIDKKESVLNSEKDSDNTNGFSYGDNTLNDATLNSKNDNIVKEETTKLVTHVKHANNIGELEPLIKYEDEATNVFSSLKYLTTLFATYILATDVVTGELYMLDQHAAHERVNYEKIYNEYTNKNILKQELITPISIDMSNHELLIIDENRDILNQLGFEIDDFGNNSILLRSVPALLNIKGLKKFFLEIIDNLKDLAKKPQDFRLKHIMKLSCTSSVKGGDNLKLVEIEKLFEQMSTLENPYTCPHGRPTIIRITKQELEKKFKRIL